MEPVAGKTGHCFVVGERHQLRALHVGLARLCRAGSPKAVVPTGQLEKIFHGCRLSRQPRHFFCWEESRPWARQEASTPGRRGRAPMPGRWRCVHPASLRWSLPRRAGWRLWVLNTAASTLILKIRLLSARPFASPLAGTCEKTPRVFSDDACAPACEEVSARAAADSVPRLRRCVGLRARDEAGAVS